MKLSNEIRESKDIRLMTLVQMISLAVLKVYEDFGQAHLTVNEMMRSSLEAMWSIHARLILLEKMPGQENVELEKFRKELKAQENKLKKHAPMLEFLEQWVEAQRNRYIGEPR
jgi:hypothetical protein